jgi:hypothetical protein
MEIVGERNVHLGPRFDYARVVMDVEPSKEFEIVSAVEVGNAARFGYDEATVDHIMEKFIFGLLDEILTNEPGPIMRVRVTLKAADIDPIDSSADAFFEAGQDAGRKLRVALGYAKMR